MSLLYNELCLLYINNNNMVYTPVSGNQPKVLYIINILNSEIAMKVPEHIIFPHTKKCSEIYYNVVAIQFSCPDQCNTKSVEEMYLI